MWDLTYDHIHIFYELHQVLKSYIIYVWVRNALKYTISSQGDIKNTPIHDIDDQNMPIFFHPRAPKLCILTQKFDNIHGFTRLQTCAIRIQVNPIQGHFDTIH